MNEAGKKRIPYLDIAKGIGILFVVLGHCTSIPVWLNHFIFSFHMPLFFILSGVTFSRDGSRDTRAFLKKNCKGLLLPYGISCALIILLQVIKALKNGEAVARTFVRWLTASVYGSGGLIPDVLQNSGIPITYIGAIWFLLALFWAKIFLMWILRSRTPLLWVMACFFTGYITSARLGWFPFSIQAGLCAVMFLYIGLLIKEHDLFAWKAVSWILKIVMLLIWIYCIVFCGQLWMVSNTYMDGFVDIIGGVCGTFIIVYISQGIEKVTWLCRIFSWLGRASLGIMCAHLIALNCLTIWHYVEVLVSHVPMPITLGEVLVVFAGSGLVTVLLYVIPWVNRRMFPASFSK